MQKFIRSSLAILFLFTLLVGSAAAQQWSETQKEIWKNVEKYNSLSDNKDLDGFLKYFDESYIGWEYSSEKPRNKTEISKAIKEDYDKNKGKTFKTTLTPLEIWVNGDMAFADYTYSSTITSKDGKIENKSGRWTDILKKKADRWVMVGDHGGEILKK